MVEYTESDGRDGESIEEIGDDSNRGEVERLCEVTPHATPRCFQRGSLKVEQG